MDAARKGWKRRNNRQRDISAMLSLFPNGVIFMNGAGEVLDEAREEEAVPKISD